MSRLTVPVSQVTVQYCRSVRRSCYLYSTYWYEQRDCGLDATKDARSLHHSQNLPNPDFPCDVSRLEPALEFLMRPTPHSRARPVLATLFANSQPRFTEAQITFLPSTLPGQIRRRERPPGTSCLLDASLVARSCRQPPSAGHSSNHLKVPVKH